MLFHLFQDLRPLHRFQSGALQLCTHLGVSAKRKQAGGLLYDQVPGVHFPAGFIANYQNGSILRPLPTEVTDLTNSQDSYIIQPA
jgi:hypothetical protein